jgi:hypothetical protein
MSMMRDALEFETAVRRETLMRQQHEEQAMMRRPTTVAMGPSDSQQPQRQSSTSLSRQSQRSSMASRGSAVPASRLGVRAATSLSGKFDGKQSMSVRERERQALLNGITPQEFGLKSQSDYHTPFETAEDRFDLNGPECVRGEVDGFEEKQRSPEEMERRAAQQAAAANVSPPKLIVMMFKFGNVRTLAVTDKLRHIGYPTLHEQFSTTSERGCVTRQQFIQVLIQYMPMREVHEALKILSCFDRTALGDVDLNVFLLGLQILLRCATAGDALRNAALLLHADGHEQPHPKIRDSL